MTDSIDKKSKENRDNLDVDLDAMLDEAESSLVPMNEFQDDEDAIDRLLMNTGFDADNALMQTESNKDIGVVKDADLHDDLDDFLGFDSFGDDFNEQASAQAIDIGRLDATLGAPLNESQDDEDTIDRLLTGADFDADDAPVQANVDEDEELDDFSDFSDFNAPESVPAVEAEQVTGDFADEVDDFAALDDDFDEADMIQDDEVDASTPAVTNLIAPAVVEEANVGEDAIEELDGFLDFSDFNEPEVDDESGQATENSISDVDETGLSDEVDDFSGFDDDFEASDLIQDDEVGISASADLVAPTEEPQAIDEQPADDENASDSLLLDAGFDIEDTLEQTGGKMDEPVVGIDLSDEVDDFSSFGDDFDASDLILDDEGEASADLVAPDEEQQAVIEEPSNDVLGDENSFDSLFADAGFDAEDVLEQTAVKSDEFADDADVGEIDNFFQLAEVSDDFSNEVGEDPLAETEKSSTQDFQDDDFLLPDFDITADTDISDLGSEAGIKEDELADPFGDTDFLSEDEVMQAFEPEAVAQKSEGNEALAEPKPKPAIEDVEDVKLSPFEFEQGDIKKQLEDAENKVKKAKLFSYVAMGFGAVALSAAAGLGMMTYGAKTEVSKLTEVVSTLEASLAKSAANSPSEEIDAMRNSVVQLNQQVDGFITELKGNPQFPVDLLNNKVPDIVAKQGMVSKALDMLQVKMGGLEEKASSTLFVAEPPKVEAVHEPEPPKVEAAHESASNAHEMAPVKTGAPHEHEPSKVEAKHEPVPVKAGTAHAPTKEGVTTDEVAPTKERAMHETALAKVETAHETTAAKVKTQPEAVKVKPITVPKAVAKEEPAKVKIPAAPGKWGVNLVAFKQEWFAKSKAAEFAQQGVFAEVIPVQEKNSTMYRLRVAGFKTKAEANSNTARIKKALNLDSVWVSDN